MNSDDLVGSSLFLFHLGNGSNHYNKIPIQVGVISESLHTFNYRKPTSLKRKNKFSTVPCNV